MTDITVDGPKIEIGNHTHRVENDIKKYVVVHDIIAVLISAPTKKLNNRNIVGFDRDGSRKWRVQSLYSDDDIPYVYIGEDNGKLIADTWTGVRVTIDPTNGHVAKTETRK